MYHRGALRLLSLSIALALGVAVPVAAQPAPYTINVILSMTGSAANLGQDAAESLTAFEKYANRTGGLRGRPIHFKIGDDQSNPAVAVQLFEAIMQSHPAVVLGPSIASPAQAMSALVKDNGPVLYALTPNLLPTSGSYVFAASVKTVDFKRIEVAYYRFKGFTRVGIITNTDASGQNNMVAIQNILKEPENKNMQVVDVETFNVNDVSMAAQAAKMKAAAPQVIFDFAEGTAFGTSLHGLNDVGLDVPVNAPAANFSPVFLNQFKNILPKELECSGLSYVNRNRPASDPQKKPIDDFYAALAADGINQPTITHAFGWDPPMLILSILRSIGPNATAAQIHDAIEKTRSFAGAGGIYDFTVGDQHGAGLSSLVIMRNDREHPGRTMIVSKQGGAPI